MAPLKQILNTDAGLPAGSYIYKIISTAPRQDPLTYSVTDQLAFISSDDSLRFHTAELRPDGVIANANENITCLERANDAPSNVVATAGRDGLIRFWDKRSKQKALEIESPHKLISALVCDAERNFVAAGIENPEDGPNSSPVYIWDQRNPSAPLRSYVESHTDTVTNLSLHPSHPTLLLSSSTDGLINIFDSAQADEDDALYQVVNHGSAVAHAGFMYPGTDIYAIGTDETMSFFALQSQKEEEEEPAPKVWGDVREGLACEYVVDLAWVGQQACVAAGKHSESHLNLIPINKGSNGSLDYSFDLEKSISFPGAHGEEIVRDSFTDLHTNITYTCGEDGQIRAWKSSEEGGMDVDEGAGSAKKRRKDKKEKARFKPY
jgi:WD40 repeat protein